MVRKVTVSLPDELLERIDREAQEAGVSRSELVQEASAHYLAHTVDERVRDEQRARRLRAIEGMREIGRMPSRDPRPSLEILREIREFDGGGPPWGTPEREQWEREVGYAAWREAQEFDDDDSGI